MAKWQILMIALFAGLVLGKMPSLLDGRLWAEDGLFLLDALRLPWWQALITPHTGYIDVVASGTMVVATHVADLEQVASISVLVACGVQVCPAILLIASRCDWLQPRWVLIVALLLVLLPPVSEEIWLSPVTSQYHLMLCTALILALPTGQRSMFVFQIMLLGIAGLTGPGPALVAPWFFVRAYLDRSWPRAIQAAVLAFGAMIEIGMVCTYPESNRHLGIELSLLFSVIGLKHIFLPLFGRHFVLSVTDKTILPATAAVTGLLGLGMMAFKAYGPEVRWLFIAAATMMGLSYFGALGTKADLLDVFFGQRYYYAPQVLLGLTLLGVARTGTLGRGWATAIVAWLILVGIWEYGRVNPAMAHGVSWHDQVALWRADPSRSITLWPSTFHIQP